MKTLKNKEFFQTIHDFLRVYLPKQRRCSEHTVKAYRIALNQLVDYISDSFNIPFCDIGFEMINTNTVTSFLDYLTNEKNVSAKTRNLKLVSINSFMAYASIVNFENTSKHIEILNIPHQREETKLVVEYMTENAISAILQQPNTMTKLGVRDMFLMILLYDTGARIQEILDLRVKDIKTGKSPIAILHGKGSKIRSVPIMSKTVKHLEKYLSIYHSNTPLLDDEYLFYVIRHNIKTQMSADNVRKFLQKYGDAARKICPEVPDNIHPHLWRHSRAMHLYQHGVDLTLLSQWLGHSNLETTLIYAHADTEFKRKAIEKSKADQFLNSENSNSYKLTDVDLIKKLYGLI